MKVVNLQLGIFIQDIRRVNNTVATFPMRSHTLAHFPTTQHVFLTTTTPAAGRSVPLHLCSTLT
jgi:hypothetical protein